MSDDAVSDHSSNPDFQPSRALVNNLTLLTDRKTRNQTKNRRRSKSLGRAETLRTNKNLLNQPNTLVGSTENILNTTSKLLDECESILNTTNPPSATPDHPKNNEQINKRISSKKTIDWSEIEYYNCSSTSWLLYQDSFKTMEDDRDQRNEKNITEHIQKIIEQKINEALYE